MPGKQQVDWAAVRRASEEVHGRGGQVIYLRIPGRAVTTNRRLDGHRGPKGAVQFMERDEPGGAWHTVAMFQVAEVLAYLKERGSTHVA